MALASKQERAKEPTTLSLTGAERVLHVEVDGKLMRHLRLGWDLGTKAEGWEHLVPGKQMGRR